MDSLKYCQQEKGLIINAWCLMPSHLHMIVRTAQLPLPEILRDFKKFTAKEIVNVMGRIQESRKGWILEMFAEVGDHLNRVKNYKVWQDGNHPELLVTAAFQKQKLEYLHSNPVVAEIVDEPQHYWYSSARDYYTTQKGLLEVEMLN